MARSRVLGGLLALVMLLAAHATAPALAADGLPPGVPVPAWAKGKRVHFEPAEPRRPSGREADSRAAHSRGPEVRAASTATPSAKLGPLTSSPPRLQYGGGLVENAPRLVLVFLGKQWEDDLSVRHELEATAESLPGSNYQKILTQYSGLEGPISSPLAGSPLIEMRYLTQASTSKVGQSAILGAAREAMELTGDGENIDTTYAVLPAPGTAEVEPFTCGYHQEINLGFDSWVPGPSVAAIMDTEPRIGCNSSKTLTHEYAESVTDPGSGDGWGTGEGRNDEIADLCNERQPGRLADGSLVAWLWDDAKGACEIEDSAPGSVPIGPYAETSHSDPSPEGAIDLTPESEELETSIYPCDLQAHYYFEYGTTTTYGGKTAESVVPAAWGAVKVHAAVTGLQHSIAYHWRVVVTTSNGTTRGVDHEFTIPYYAEVREAWASRTGHTEATLFGEVRPVGVETKYYFEYGTTTAYGSTTAEASAGSGSGFTEVSAPLAGLQIGTRYHFRLVAINSRGTTTGEDKEFETLGGKPRVFAEEIYTLGYTSATLKGNVYGKGEVTKYYFEYGTTEAYGLSTVERESPGEEFEEEKEPVIGLAPGTLYHYRVVASNSYGTSYGQDKSFSTPHEPLAETDAPEAVGYGDATLKGTVDPRGTTTSYLFEYGTSQTYGAHTAEVTAGSGTGDVQAAQSVHNLAEDTIYHFRVVAATQYGNIYGTDHTFLTGIEPSAQTDAPSTVGPEGATLSGTIDPHGTEVAYYFEYGLTSGYGMSTAQASAGSGSGDVEVSQAISGLSPGAAYHYRLVADYDSVMQYGGDMTFTATALPPLVEPIVTPPSTPLAPIVGLAPSPAPVSPGRNGPSLRVVHHGNSLLVVLELDRRAARVEIDATVPPQQFSATKPRGRRGPLVLARQVHTTVEAGRPKFLLPLDMARIQELRHRHLRLTVTATITSLGGARQKISRMLSI